MNVTVPVELLVSVEAVTVEFPVTAFAEVKEVREEVNKEVNDEVNEEVNEEVRTEVAVEAGMVETVRTVVDGVLRVVDERVSDSVSAGDNEVRLRVV